ncbi:peptide-methionine (S)-S-oxide reductase MsrA [Dokdonia sp. Hel_I_53]|uniref:peptide-methionine (S)-S-oxide reductase MsrA n=1 Tax=Dokdonia sp. Hel_I_53 TaxID=1566287 RepID=UPI00119C8165|nr:peptide-methionine (S)-S-oxide reductase MsrA [Dokdonia sp. Hel_I_53]TVZ52101.1 peptide-methionine (S)-S-oxide reductase [Dokdonia sp. Hel_I_53]
MKFATIIAALTILTSCNNFTTTMTEPTASLEPVEVTSQNGMKKAYFASGCFWCVESIFESVKGVEEAVSGYSGGKEDNPTYKQVSYGRTTHAEAVEVLYDPEIISFQQLVDVFFGSQDPTTANRQGPDAGIQYRSIAFYQNDSEKNIIEQTIDRLNKSTYNGAIVTQVLPFRKFWIAEDYHQDYEKNNPNNPYIQSVSIPRYKRFAKKFPELLKEGAH